MPTLIRPILIFATVLISSCALAEGTKWIYVNPASIGALQTFEIAMDTNEVTYSGHVSDAWLNCDKERVKYVICFVSSRLVMKLPHEALNTGEWIDNGTKHRSYFHEDLHLLGQSMGDVYIVSIEGEMKQGFVYTPDKGVIAIFSDQSDSNVVALIDGKCGFGAPSECYE